MVNKKGQLEDAAGTAILDDSGKPIKATKEQIKLAKDGEPVKVTEEQVQKAEEQINKASEVLKEEQK